MPQVDFATPLGNDFSWTNANARKLQNSPTHRSRTDGDAYTSTSASTNTPEKFHEHPRSASDLVKLRFRRASSSIHSLVKSFQSSTPKSVLRMMATGVACLAAMLLLFQLLLAHLHGKNEDVFRKAAPLTTTKTTLVLMGYSPERLNNYNKLFSTYGGMENVVDKVLFLWNNLNVPPPTVPAQTKVPIQVLPQVENSMNNRFGSDVSKHASTDSIMVVDDDVLLSSSLLREMVDEWVHSHNDVKSRPIVGVQGDGRTVGYQEGYRFPCTRLSGWVLQPYCWTSFLGSSEWKNRLNVVIGKTMLFSKRFVEVYQADETVWTYNGPGGKHCEDIMMNALVLNATGQDPIFVSLDDQRQLRKASPETEKKLRETLDSGGGLSAGDLRAMLRWRDERTECVQWAAQHYPKSVWEARQ